jgi:hypothetical protein
VGSIAPGRQFGSYWCVPNVCRVRLRFCHDVIIIIVILVPNVISNSCIFGMVNTDTNFSKCLTNGLLGMALVLSLQLCLFDCRSTIALSASLPLT